MTNNPLRQLMTEKRNPRSFNLDSLSSLALVRLINEEDMGIPQAVAKADQVIARAIDLGVSSIGQGGRLIYMGSGTSGRLGVLDASECLPTFGVGEEMILGIIAGGDEALRHPVEAVEDNETLAVTDLKMNHFKKEDLLCLLSASGRTPYCLAGLGYAKDMGAKTLAISCQTGSALGRLADLAIEVDVGPEVLTGSTRMKAGTAQKIILNTLSTGIMVKLGKVYENLMVDLQATNKKLQHRAKTMVMTLTHCNEKEALRLLTLTKGQVKPAILMAKKNIDYPQAQALLKKHKGHLTKCFY